MLTSNGQKKSKLKRWLINVLILILTMILMLALSEVAFRWLDGYQLSTIQLNQEPDTVQSAE